MIKDQKKTIKIGALFRNARDRLTDCKEILLLLEKETLIEIQKRKP